MHDTKTSEFCPSCSHLQPTGTFETSPNEKPPFKRFRVQTERDGSTINYGDYDTIEMARAGACGSDAVIVARDISKSLQGELLTQLKCALALGYTHPFQVEGDADDGFKPLYGTRASTGEFAIIPPYTRSIDCLQDDIADFPKRVHDYMFREMIMAASSKDTHTHLLTAEDLVGCFLRALDSHAGTAAEALSYTEIARGITQRLCTCKEKHGTLILKWIGFEMVDGSAACFDLYLCDSCKWVFGDYPAEFERAIKGGEHKVLEQLHKVIIENTR